MSNLSAAASEVFEILQSFNYSMMLWDETGQRTDDPEEARQIFTKPEGLMITIAEDGENSAITLFHGKSTPIQNITGLGDSLRTVATSSNLLFHNQQFGKDTIEPKDFAPSMSEGRRDINTRIIRDHRDSYTKRTQMSNYLAGLCENFYGTRRSSYLKMENARMIVRHSAQIDESKVGARSRFVESIFCENAAGERFLFPTTNLAAGRAMTQHLNHGGAFADVVGQQITRMAQDYSNLGACVRYVGSNAELSESAVPVREKCRSRMMEMRKVFERMNRPNGYVAESARIIEASKTLNETDAKTAVPLDRLTELRATLEDDDHLLSNKVLESVCKAIDEDDDAEDMGGDESEIDEDRADSTQVKRGPQKGAVAKPAFKAKDEAMIGVLGRPVTVRAWEDLRQGAIDLTAKPRIDPETRYTNRTAELLHKLGQILPLVRDDTLNNLLSFVASDIPLERDPARLRILRTVATCALKAAGIGLDEGLPKMGVVREYAEWIGSHGTKSLMEDAMGNPYERDTSQSDSAADSAISDFNATDFFESEEAQDMLFGRNEDSDPQEKDLSAGEITDALEAYLRTYIERHYGEHVQDTSDLAAELLATAEAEFQSRGYTIDGQSSDQSGEGQLQLAAEGEFDGMELSREDVLLPKPGQGRSLRREIEPALVTDPVDGREERPDGAYIERMRTLAGLRR